MKKLILPLLLLVAFGILAAVESAPSEIVGYVKYDIYAAKNNNIALPMIKTPTDYAMASDVGNAIPGCTAVRWLDASVTPPQWKSCTKAGTIWPPATNFAVSNGKPLQVYTSTAGAFYSIGDLPASPLPTYALYAAKNNMIMVPLDKSALNMASLVGNSITGCTAVRWLDASVTPAQWKSCTKAGTIWPPATNFATEIGDPLQVYTSTAGTWPGAAKLSK
jgi:hypothetical protein